MAKHLDLCKQISSQVGLNEDQKYHELFKPDDPYNEALHFLALRNFKRFVAVLGYLFERNHFDLILFGGDSGVGLSKAVEIIYSQLKLDLPLIISLPIIRWDPKWLVYSGQDTKLFDNSIFIPQVKDKVNSLEKLEKILFVDDEIGNGNTARAATNLVLEAIDKSKIAKKVTLTIIAEDQGFNPENFMENLECEFYPFAEETEGINNILSYIVPWSIEKQIKDCFSNEEMGSKVRMNSLLNLPSKEFERFPEYIIEKPIFTDRFVNQLKKEIPNFTKLQQEFERLLIQWIQEAIIEYQK